MIAAAPTTGTPPGSRAGLRRRAAVDVVVLWVASRVWFEAIALVVRAIGGPHDPSTSSNSAGRPGFFGLFYQWDSGWFGCIAQHGYSGAGPGCTGDPVLGRPSFFPGYPLLARVIARAVGGGTVTTSGVTVSTWLVAQLAALAAGFALHRWVQDEHGTDAARWATALLLLGPYAVFLVASYSESLFLAFAVAAWLAATRRRYPLAGLLAAAAGFTRVNGVFLAVALLVLCWEQARRSGRRPRARDLLACVPGFAGAAVYLGWLWSVSGSASTWQQSQRRYFHRYLDQPFGTAWRSFKVLATDHRAAYLVQHLEEWLFVLVGLACLAVFVRRRSWAAATYLLLTLVPLMTSTTYLSLARNSLTVFPLFALAGVTVTTSPRRRWVVAGLVLAGVLSVVNAVALARGQWAD